VKQDNILKLVVVLTVICAISAFALAIVYNVTKEPIAEQKRLEMIKAIKSVLPSSAVNDPVKDKKVIEQRNVFIGKDSSGKVVGAAFKVVSNEGYSGKIEIMLGINSKDDSVNGIEILAMAETPGLGAKITEDRFKNQFKKRNLKNTNWKVKKDGGDIDQISGATISPRAVTKAVYNGLKFYKKNKKEILKN
jgi:electron transport complex protein RnfG